MTRPELQAMVSLVRQAYQDALDGKAVSFTGANGRAITNHDPAALRAELTYWEDRLQRATRRGNGYKLASFN